MEADPDTELPELQRLALAHAPAFARHATGTLFLLDNRLAGIVRRQGEPVLAQMRLAWWRDTLSAPVSLWPAGEPLLASLREWPEPARLVAMVDGWEQLLAGSFDRPAIEAFAAGRAEGFRALAEAIGVDPAGVVPAASTWALADLAANLSDPVERALAVETGLAIAPALPQARALRPLVILAGLGRRALNRGGVPLLDGRRAALVAFRLGLLGC